MRALVAAALFRKSVHADLTIFVCVAFPCIITVDTLVILEVIKKNTREKMSVVNKFVNQNQ